MEQFWYIVYLYRILCRFICAMGALKKLKKNPTKKNKIEKAKKQFISKKLLVKINRLTASDIREINLINNINETEKTEITYDFALNRTGDGHWNCQDITNEIEEISSNGDIIEIKFPHSKANANLISENRQYKLRTRPEKSKKLPIKTKPITTISEVNFATKKKTLWANCKKTINRSKLVDGAIIFAKQVGYSPWPCKIKKFTKNNKSATVEYLGYTNFIGTVKSVEMVQMDQHSQDAIGKLINFILVTKSIREFPEFSKAIQELRAVMNFT